VTAPDRDPAAERALIGCCLLSAECCEESWDACRPEDFSSSQHAACWRAVQALCRAGRGVDTITLVGALETAGELAAAGGHEALLGLTDTVPTLALARQHAQRVSELAAQRAVTRAAKLIAAEGESGVEDVPAYLARSERAIADAADGGVQERGLVTYGQAAEMAYAEVVARAAGDHGAGSPRPTGLTLLDYMLSGGLWPGALYILAGRPAMGKSACAQGIAEHVGRSAPVLFHSLEMPAAEIGARGLAGNAGVDGSRIRANKLSHDDMSRLAAAVTAHDAIGISIDDTPGVTVADVRRRARRLKRTSGLGLVVVDYLQLMRAVKPSGSREQDVAEMSRSMKGIAKELDVPVLALSQLNRNCEARADKRPEMGDLRESGAIEQDADVIMFVYRDEKYNPETQDKGIAEIIVAKHRAGAEGTVRVAFRAETTTFHNLEQWRE